MEASKAADVDEYEQAATTYVDRYLHLVQNLPNDLQSIISQVRELDTRTCMELREYDSRHNAYLKDLRAGDVASRRSSHMALRRSLVREREYGDEKLQMANQLVDVVEGAVRVLEEDLQRLEAARMEPDYATTNGSYGRQQHDYHVAAVAGQHGSAHHAASAVGGGHHHSHGAHSSAAAHQQAHHHHHHHLHQQQQQQHHQHQQQQAHLDHHHHAGQSGGGAMAGAGGGSGGTGHYHARGDERAAAAGPKAKRVKKSKERVADSDDASAGGAAGGQRKGDVGGGAASSTASASSAATGRPEGKKPRRKEGKVAGKRHSVDKDRLGTGGSGGGGAQKAVASAASSAAATGAGLAAKALAQVPTDIPYDPNEPTYCLCRQVSYGEMIGCDNASCEVEWFHFGCVGLTSKPKGKWYCPNCRRDHHRPDQAKLSADKSGRGR